MTTSLPIKNTSPESTHSTIHLEDDSDEEWLPTNAIHDERQSLLLGLDQHAVPRYMTASPLPSARISDNSPKDTWDTFKVRSKYYLPILQWLPLYRFHLFWGDLIAGITLSCLLIPQGLSYATALCKLDAIHGLYAIAFPAITYAIFGMSKQMSVGPEATISLLVGSSIAQVNHDKSDPVDALAWACLMTIFVGIFTFLLGIFRLGFLDSLMSRALLRGFISGVAVVVALQQGIILLGLVDRSESWGITEASSSIARLMFLVENVPYAHALTTTVSAVSILSLALARVVKRVRVRWVQLVPEVLFVVIVACLVTWWRDWEHQGLGILGTIEGRGIPAPSIPALPSSAKHMKDLLVSSAMIAVIGFVESIVIAKTYSSKHNYSVSANRELVALGVSNIVGGLFEGIPAFGSVARSKINDKAGARTQMASLITGLLALVAISLLPYFYYLPKCVLSSIIFVAVVSLLGELPHDLAFMLRIGAWRDLSLLVVTFLATVTISLEFGTLLAVTVSLLLTIKETSYPRISIMGRVKGTHNKFRPIQDDPNVIEHLEDVLIVRIDEPLFFANTGQLKDRLRRLEQFGDMSIHPSESPRLLRQLSYMIFDVNNMPEIDASAVQILYEIVEAYHARKVRVYFVRLREQPMALFRKSGLLEMVGVENLFRKVSDAIEVIEKDMTNNNQISFE
ncbi:MAG: sulfate transporter family-domain-containing protein [Benjaminiella poitrasii]|nr:MAG: sulfate transporter family-domain-containing protein [Benjaminiella poitrasii]